MSITSIHGYFEAMVRAKAATPQQCEGCHLTRSAFFLITHHEKNYSQIPRVSSISKSANIAKLCGVTTV